MKIWTRSTRSWKFTLWSYGFLIVSFGFIITKARFATFDNWFLTLKSGLLHSRRVGKYVLESGIFLSLKMRIRNVHYVGKQVSLRRNKRTCIQDLCPEGNLCLCACAGTRRLCPSSQRSVSCLTIDISDMGRNAAGLYRSNIRNEDMSRNSKETLTDLGRLDIWSYSDQSRPKFLSKVLGELKSFKTTHFISLLLTLHDPPNLKLESHC